MDGTSLSAKEGTKKGKKGKERRRWAEGPTLVQSAKAEPALLLLSRPVHLSRSPSRPSSHRPSRSTSLSRAELGHRAGPTMFRA